MIQSMLVDKALDDDNVMMQRTVTISYLQMASLFPADTTLVALKKVSRHLASSSPLAHDCGSNFSSGLVVWLTVEPEENVVSNTQK